MVRMTVFVFLALLVVRTAAALDIESLDQSTVAALSAEGPLVSIAESAAGKFEMATAAMVIDAPPQQVWDTISDFASYPDWMPQVAEVQVQEATDEGVDVAYTLEFSLVITKKMDYTLRYRDVGNHRMEYSLVTGDFAANEGYWVVRPYAGGTQSILYYANYVDYSSIKLLRGFLKQQPTLELAFGASGVAVIARSVKQRVEGG